jgi:hypothetical protein
MKGFHRPNANPIQQDGSFRTGYVPVTPGGTYCFWMASKTEDQAWARLLIDAAHMPYKGKAGFQRIGYTVELVKRDGK